MEQRVNIPRCVHSFHARLPSFPMPLRVSTHNFMTRRFSCDGTLARWTLRRVSGFLPQRPVTLLLVARSGPWEA